MLTIFVHFIYIVFDFVMGKLYGCFAKSFDKSCVDVKGHSLRMSSEKGEKQDGS